MNLSSISIIPEKKELSLSASSSCKTGWPDRLCADPRCRGPVAAWQLSSADEDSASRQRTHRPYHV